MTPEVKQRIEQIRRGEVPEGYKKTALGIVPANWIETTLGKIYTERNEPGNDSLPLLMVSIHSGVSDGEVAEEDLPKKVKRIEDKSQYKHAMPGDLVFNMMRAWQGAIGSVRTEGMVSPAYIVAKPNDMVDPIFMDYYMKMPRMISMIHRQSYGVTDFRLRLYWDSFSPIPCVLPPIEEQRRIAEILTEQETLVKLQMMETESLEQLSEAYVAKMFPENGNNLPELRFKEYTQPWEQHKFGDIFEEHSEKGHAELPVLTIVQGGGTVRRDESERKLHYDKSSLANYKMVKEGDFVVHLRSFEGGLEKATMSGIVSPAYHVFRGDGIDPSFFYLYFRSSKFIKKELKPHVYGIRDGRSIDVEGMKTIYIPWASRQEQQTIGEYFEVLGKLIAIHQHKATLLKDKMSALMQLLLTGQLQVSV